MVDLQKVISSMGKINNADRLVCQYTNMITSSSGFWVGDDPLDYGSPLLMAQLILIFFITRTTYFLLRPLGQTMAISQIIAGIIINPSIIGRDTIYARKLFPPGGIVVLETLANFILMLYVFMLGVQVDTTLIKNIGKKATVIGVSSFVFPYFLGGAAYFIIRRFAAVETEAEIGLRFVMALNSMTSFVVITDLLTELKILNSELGRLASSCSLISSTCGWLLTFIMTNLNLSRRDSLVTMNLSIAILIGFYTTMIFVLRPLVIWIVRDTPEGKIIKHSHFLIILLIVLGTGLCGEFIGQRGAFSAFILGVVLPDGPPLGTTLAKKIKVIVSGFLLPVFCAISGLRTQVLSIKTSSSIVIEVLILLGYVVKFITVTLTSLYFNFSFYDAVPLAMIMSCKGVMEIAILSMWIESNVINRQLFTLSIFTMVVITGFATPTIRRLYDPSKRYIPHKRKTILYIAPNTELRVLVCIHNEENVPAIIDLLEATNSTRASPVSVIVLQLTELTGRAQSILAPHHRRNNRPPSSNANMTRSERIVKAFESFEKCNQGNFVVQHFTAEAPYASMHADICTLALDRRTTIIIIPFHKQWAIDGTLEATFASIRAVNQQVMHKAPCSVGVLIDRGPIREKNRPTLLGSKMVGQPLYQIAMLFIGGYDDREALAYGIRMAEHRNVSFTIVHLRSNNTCEKDTREDEELINDIRANAGGKNKKKIIYREEIVKDGVGTTKVVRTLEDGFDLIVVGRHHAPDSIPTWGLSEWSECTELGLVGDMLATSDFEFSVLVVQQQPEGAELVKSPKKTVSRGRYGDKRIYHDYSEDENDHSQSHILSP